MKSFIFSLFGFVLLFSFATVQEGFSHSFMQNVYAECSAEKIADGVPCSDHGFTPPDQTQVNEKINEPDFRVQVLKLINYFLSFLGLLAVGAIVYGGVIMVADFGSEENVKKAKNIILWSAVGIVIVLLSYSFVNWVMQSGGGVSASTTGKTPITSQNTNPNSNLNTTNQNPNIPGITQPLNSIPGTYPATGIITNDIKYVDNINKILKSLGVPDQTTTDLLGLISDVQNKPSGDYSMQYAKIADALSKVTGGTGQSYYDTIKEVMKFQGYDAPVAESIINKIKNGEVLTTDDYNKLKNAVRYGFLLQQFESELNILYKSMPQTAENIAAYNDVVNLFMEVKNDPTSEVAIQKLQDSFNRFKNIIKTTPFMIANIAVNPSGGPAPLSVSFDGTNSLDPHNITIPKDNFVWTYLDSQGVEKTIGKGPIVEYEFTEPGLFVVQLRVSTAMMESGYKTAMDGVAKARIRVSSQEGDIQVFINNKKVDSVRKLNIADAKQGVSFDAKHSTPKVGRKIVEYKWIFGDGATDYSENGDPVTHAYEKVGQYSVKLDVKDNTGETITKELKVIVEHLSAEIDVTPDTGNTQTVFELNGLKSKSSDFTIQNYDWTISDPQGKVVQQSDKDKLSFHPHTPGDYAVKLSIRDGGKNQTTGVYTLHIKSLPPTASFIAHHKSYSQPAAILFDAASSNDPDSDPLVYSWDFNGDGVFEIENSANASIEYTYPQAGSFKPVLKVTDSYSESDTLTQIVTINSTLAVDFDIEPIAAIKDTAIIFTPQSNQGTKFYWDFGDGNHNSTGNEKTSHTYKTAGNYSIALTSFDANGNENKVMKRVFIGDADTPVAAYQIEIGGERIYPETNVCGQKLGIIVNRRDNIKFIGTPSLNIDGSGYMLDFTWDFGDGEFGTTKVASHRYTETTGDTCFSLVLGVNDRTSGKSNKTESVAVKVINMPPTLQRLTVNTNTDNANLYTPLDIRLQAQGASDPDGTIVNYRWWYRGIHDAADKKFGIVQTQQPFANITIDAQGLSGLENEYIFVVEMVDNEGSTISSDDVLGIGPSIKVKNGNIDSPVVDFSMDKNQVLVGDTISFLAQIKNIAPSDMSKVSFEWDFDGDGTIDDTSSGMQAARRFDTPGTYETRVRVKYKGLTSSKTHTVFVDKISKYPLAAFTFQTEDLSFLGNAETARSDPALAAPLQYFWDFDRFTDADGDGNPSNDVQAQGVEAQFTYDRSGTYYVTLRVRDKTGSEDTVERKIDIQKGKVSSTSQTGNSGAKRKESLHIQSDSNPITTLELSAATDVPEVGTPTDIAAQVFNADGTPYSGEVTFTIMTGQATLSNISIKAVNGVAHTMLTPQSTGTIVIQATAKNTFYETLTESLSLQARNILP